MGEVLPLPLPPPMPPPPVALGKGDAVAVCASPLVVWRIEGVTEAQALLLCCVVPLAVPPRGAEALGEVQPLGASGVDEGGPLADAERSGERVAEGGGVQLLLAEGESESAPLNVGAGEGVTTAVPEALAPDAIDGVPGKLAEAEPLPPRAVPVGAAGEREGAALEVCAAQGVGTLLTKALMDAEMEVQEDTEGLAAVEEVGATEDVEGKEAEPAAESVVHAEGEASALALPPYGVGVAATLKVLVPAGEAESVLATLTLARAGVAVAVAQAEAVASRLLLGCAPLGVARGDDEIEGLTEVMKEMESRAEREGHAVAQLEARAERDTEGEGESERVRATVPVAQPLALPAPREGEGDPETLARALCSEDADGESVSCAGVGVSDTVERELPLRAPLLVPKPPDMLGEGEAEALSLSVAGRPLTVPNTVTVGTREALRAGEGDAVGSAPLSVGGAEGVPPPLAVASLPLPVPLALRDERAETERLGERL